MIQAVLVAGDRGASRSVRGESKAFLPVAGRPMVVHVLEALLYTPEVGEIFVVGDAPRLEKTFAAHGVLPLAATRGRAVHIIPQRSSLYENVWYTFLRGLPPGEPDPSHPLLVVPTDVPLIVPDEISAFVGRALEADADYVIGLTPERSLEPYRPVDGEPGVDMACFNVAEGRFRQNNLHLVRPLSIGNRHYVQDMYENRYQKQLGPMLGLFWRLLRKEARNLWVVGFYVVLHLAGVLHRRGYRRASDLVRGLARLRTVERGMSDLLRARVRCVSTELGGAALDIDNEADLEAAEAMFGRWKALQSRLPKRLTPAA